MVAGYGGRVWRQGKLYIKILYPFYYSIFKKLKYFFATNLSTTPTTKQQYELSNQFRKAPSWH